MSNPIQHSDAEILDACKQLVARGVDPTYRSLRDAGTRCCGSRLLHIRNDAIQAGELILPSGTKIRDSRIRFDSAQSDRSTPHISVAIKREPFIPKTPADFLAREKKVRASLRQHSNAMRVAEAKAERAFISRFQVRHFEQSTFAFASV